MKKSQNNDIRHQYKLGITEDTTLTISENIIIWADFHESKFHSFNHDWQFASRMDFAHQTSLSPLDKLSNLLAIASLITKVKQGKYTTF